MREWQPGDVAMVAFRGTEVMATFYDTGSEQGWYHGLGLTDRHYIAEVGEAPARPLVVIDPEDRESVERLMDLYAAVPWASKKASDRPDVPEMQTALREFANPTPPRPDEPLGLGAVVEAINGNHFVRIDMGTQAWRRKGDIDPAGTCDWSDIAAVRILSEGVTP